MRSGGEVGKGHEESTEHAWRGAHLPHVALYEGHLLGVSALRRTKQRGHIEVEEAAERGMQIEKKLVA